MEFILMLVCCFILNMAILNDPRTALLIALIFGSLGWLLGSLIQY